MEAARVTMSLEEENTQVLNLVQAMLGAVSSNLRRVALQVPKPGAVRLTFIIERDDPQDREEIQDIAFEFEALQTEGVDLDVDIGVDDRPNSELRLPGRLVFARKE